MRHENLYEKCIKEVLLICSDGFPILNMNNLHVSATSYHTEHNKNVWKTFFVLQWGFIHTACVELSTAHLSKEKLRYYHFLNPRYTQNKNSLRNIFITLGSSTIM